MRMCLSILFILAGLRSYAQPGGTIAGSVKNSEAKPIEGITVSLFLKGDSTAIKTTQTDKNGAYQFINIAKGIYLVKATAVGMKVAVSSFVEISNEAPATAPGLVMMADEKVLKEVTVTANTSPLQAKSGKLIYSIEKTISATGSNAFDQLRRTPGIAVDGEDNILLKGSSTVNIMIDGKMTYLTSQQLTTYLKSLPTENLNRIEVMATPSSEFDAAGNMGIINIVTKKMNRQGYALNISAGGGAGRYVQTTDGFIGNIRTKTLNVFGSYTYNYNHTYLDRTSFRTISTFGKVSNYDRQSFDPSFSTSHNYKAGVDFYLSKKMELGAVYTGSSRRWERIAAGPTYLRNVAGEIDSVVQNSNLTLEPGYNNAYNLNYKFIFDTSGAQLTADADYATYKSNSTGSLDNGLFSVTGTALQPYQSLAFHQPGNITIRSFKVDVVLPVKNWSAKTGVKYASIISDNDFVYDSLINGVYVYSKALSNHFIYTEKVYAGYASISKQINKSVSIDGGLRIEHTKSNGNSITSNINTPRRYTNIFPFVSLTKTLSGDNSLNVSITRRINRPVYANLNPFRYFFDKYSYVEGNPYLQPELSWNGSASFTYKQNYIITASYSRTTNAMSSFAMQDSVGGILRLSTYNFSYRDAADILLIVPVKLTSFWNVQNTASISYLSYLYTEGKEVFQPRRVSVDVQTVHSFRLLLSISAELTAQYTSPTLSGVYLIKRYFVMDSGLKRSFLKNKLDANLAVTDVFKTNRYWGYSIYGPTNVRYDHRLDSRRVKLSLVYHIGGKLSAGKERGLEEQNRL